MNRAIMGLLPLALAAGCKTTGIQQSQLQGVTSETLDRLGDAGPKPRYEAFRQADTIRMSLFFTFDYEQGRRGFWRGADIEQRQNPDLEQGRRQWDRATVALRDVRDWLLDRSANDRLFSCSQQDGAWRDGRYYESLLICDGPNFVEGRAPWEIRLYLGAPEATAPVFGRAMATDDIVLLNGHFYAHDAAQADFGDGRWSRIYGPALQTFEELASSHPKPYRIVVFNGCGSENIEDAVFRAARQLGIEHDLEMVANRGFSNYRHFRAQIPRFLLALNRGEPWSKVIRAFGTPEYGFDRSIPVFRNHEHVTDRHGNRQGFQGQGRWVSP